MFICDNCGQCSSPKMPCKKVVVKKRKFFHPERPRSKKGMALLKNGKKKIVWIPDLGGWGEQIVTESKMCLSCAAAFDQGIK